MPWKGAFANLPLDVLTQSVIEGHALLQDDE
jgi:hypothetical protein